MTYVSLDPEGLQKVINDLSSYGSKARDYRESVKNTNDRNDSPADLASSLEIIAGSVSALEHKAKDLQARLDSAKAANESGITPMGADGTIYYVIPDGLDDTAKNALAFNHVESIKKAKADAEALYQAKNSSTGRSSDGRSFNEILEGMKGMRDDPVYSSRLIAVLGEHPPLVESDLNKDGAKRFLEIMQVARESCTAEVLSPGFENLSHVLAAASRNDVNGAGLIGGGALAERIYQASNSDYMSRLTLNAALSEFSKSSETGYVNPETNERLPFFGTDFLTYLANAYEKDDAGSLKEPSETINLTRYDGDVLGGVILAMGKNPSAALEYMAGSGDVDSDGNWIPSEEGQKRWDMLKHRGWDTARIEGLISAVGAASSYRNTAYNEDSPQYLKDADARATWLSSQGIRYMTEEINKGDITEKMKEGAAVIIANSPEEVTAVANRKTMSEGSSGPVLQDVDDRQVAKLLYRIMDNANAVNTIGTGVGAFHHSLIDQEMAQSEKRTGDNLAVKYRSAAATDAFLRAISNKKLDDDKEEVNENYEKRRDSVNRSMDVLSSTVLLGVTALSPAGSALVPAAVAVGASIAAPVASDAITGKKPDLPTISTSENAPSKYDLLRTRAYSDAAKYKLLDERSVQIAKNKGVLVDVEGNPVELPVLVDEEGNPVSVDEKGNPVPRVDEEGKPVQVHVNDDLKDYVQEVNSWADDARKANQDESPDATVAKIDTNINEGSSLAEGWVKEKFDGNSSLRK